MTYNPNVPLPTDNLSDSQGDLKTNFTAANNTFAVNHFPLADLTAQNGFHRDINQAKRVGNATNVTDCYTLFTKDYTADSTGAVTDTQLFGITAGGGVSQFSGNLALNDGWCWVGGVLLQWGGSAVAGTGSFASGTATGTVTFKDRVVGAIPFPNACFAVVAIPFFGAAPGGSRFAGITITSKSATTFNWSCNGSSSAASGFYWVAVGN